jgi:hypothetical protein
MIIEASRYALVLLRSNAAPYVWVLTESSHRILRISFWAASSQYDAIH